MAPLKNQPSESSAKHGNIEKERRDWLTLHVLLPIENNYRVLMTPGNIDFWCHFFIGWTRGQIVQTFEFILRECQRTPTGADWTRFRVKPTESLPAFLNETTEQMLERLGNNATAWGKAVCEITRWGICEHDTAGLHVPTETPSGMSGNGYNRMPEAYDRLADAARKFNRPESEVLAFVEAKRLTLEIRYAYAASRKKYLQMRRVNRG